MARLLACLNCEHDWTADVARFLVQPLATVLDIGCGIRPQTYVLPAETHYLADPHGPYLDRVLRDWPHGTSPRAVMIETDWAGVLNRFAPGSVDTVFLLDVIEHLDKETALELLERTIAIASRQVVTFTPMGLLPQEPSGADAWGFTGTGHLQTHRSGWEPSDFDDRWGYIISLGFHRTDAEGEPLEGGSRDAWWGILTK